MTENPVDSPIPAEVDSKSESDESLADLLSEIQRRLGDDNRIRRNVPGDGRLRIDRALPFLCVYRRPESESDHGTAELVTTEASYLFSSADPAIHNELARICEAVRDVCLQRFSAFLVIELWSEDLSTEFGHSSHLLHPAFKIVTGEVEGIKATVDALSKSLSEVHFTEHFASVSRERVDVVSPPGIPPLLVSSGALAENCFVIGLAIHPVYRSPDGATLFPMVLQRLRRQLAIAVRKALFVFTGDACDEPPGHYHALGPTALVKAVPLVDQQLCDVSTAFDYLMQITPVNLDAAWREFREEKFRTAPTFHYRPLPRNPAELKKQLFSVPIDRIEDPTLADLFWEKQGELDLQISSLRDIGTERFLYGSLQLYGEVEPELLELAEQLLAAVSTGETIGDEDGAEAETARFGCDELCERVQEEIAAYRARNDDFHATVQRCSDIASGIMVSGDTVFVSNSVNVPESRIDGLIHHEIGTHLLTWFNGRRQPFQQLYAGLAGYEAFQEGIAVLAEYLVEGLTATRIRTLAARVVAAHMLVSGRSFVETFEFLLAEGFSQRSAFQVAARIWRGGGTTKDAIYLRGLREVLDFVACRPKSDVNLWYVGKIAASHVPAVTDLMRRDIIKPPALLPRYLETEKARDLLDQCTDKSVLELLTPRNRSPGNA